MSIRKKKAEAIIGALMTDLAASGSFDTLAIIKQAATQTTSEDNIWSELDSQLSIVKDTVPFWSGAVERNAIRYLDYAIRERTSTIPALLEELSKAIDSNKDNYDNLQKAQDAVDKMKLAAKRIGGPEIPQPADAARAAEEAYQKYIVKGAQELEAFFEKYQIEDNPKDDYWSEPHFNIAKKLILDDAKVQRLVSHYNKNGEAKSKLLARSDFLQGAFELYQHVSGQVKKASSELDKLPTRI